MGAGGCKCWQSMSTRVCAHVACPARRNAGEGLDCLFSCAGGWRRGGGKGCVCVLLLKGTRGGQEFWVVGRFWWGLQPPFDWLKFPFGGWCYILKFLRTFAEEYLSLVKFCSTAKRCCLLHRFTVGPEQAFIQNMPGVSNLSTLEPLFNLRLIYSWQDWLVKSTNTLNWDMSLGMAVINCTFK